MENLKRKQNKKKEKTKENKTRRVHIVVSESEYEQLLEYAKEFKTVSNYIRFSCLEKGEKSFILTKELIILLKQLTTEMNTIGRNMHQMARYSSFLLDNKVSFDSLNSFNNQLIKYMEMQMRFEKLLKSLFKNT